ncbi:Fis family transcriptional regulator [Caballeronia temeraria]|uniref:Fis family transcriptional regulator n=1 Tax=Caballeronia temeraria TaxID=1777137 RepID=A0A158BXW8_9BURK|nr:hypothetical protein [Caballeronia temeraria]SAK74954.1 Fis family transcriptional regulator [Caballeronia temeraria]
MPVSKKRKSPKKPGPLQSKKFLLPMPREDADALCLQSRLALEAVRGQRAARQEAIVLAQTVLLTSFLTESGHGLLDLPFVRQVEEAVLAILDVAKISGEWNFSESLVESLTTVVNEHDRQLREVRFGHIVAATERLDRMVASVRLQG